MQCGGAEGGKVQRSAIVKWNFYDCASIKSSRGSEDPSVCVRTKQESSWLTSQRSVAQLTRGHSGLDDKQGAVSSTAL